MLFSEAIQEMAHVSGVQGPQWGDDEGGQKVKLMNPSEHQVRRSRVGIAAECESTEDQVPLQSLSQAHGGCYSVFSSLTQSSATLLPGRVPIRPHRRPKSQ